MITDIFNKNIIKVLTFFSVSPGSRFTRKEIKKKTMLNNATLDNALNMLLSNELLVKERRFLSLNFKNKYLKNILDAVKEEHLRFREAPLKIYYCLLDVSCQLSLIKSIKKAYLFGSYTKLTYTERSDVDIAVFLAKEDKKIINKVKSEVNKIEKRYSNSIELHFFEAKDIKQKDPLIKEILRNGISLF